MSLAGPEPAIRIGSGLWLDPPQEWKNVVEEFDDVRRDQMQGRSLGALLRAGESEKVR